MNKPIPRPEHMPLGPKKAFKKRTITHAQWLMRGRQLYGRNMAAWMFRCIQCGHVQSIDGTRKAMELRGKKHEVPERLGNMIYFSCEGRWNDRVGCDWTLGGLFSGGVTSVVKPDGSEVNTFEFAADPVRKPCYYLPYEERSYVKNTGDKQA